MTDQPTRKPVPFGLIGALALVLLAEWTIVRHRLDTMDASLWTYEAARANMAANVEGTGFLCFGDSMVKHGVAPKVIEARTGLKGYNLSIPGSSAPASYILFRRAIEAGARPKAVLVDFMPCLLDTDAWRNVTNWPYIATYADCLELAWYSRDAKLFAALASRKTLPSVGASESIRANVMLAFKGAGELNRLGVMVALRAWEANRGLAIDGYRFNPNFDIKEGAKPLFSKVEVSPLNRHYVDRFMALAAAHGVKVFWLIPPHMPLLQAELERNGYAAKQEALVRSMAAQYPGLIVVDGRRANYDNPTSFIDTHHLSFGGAHDYSEELAIILRDRLARADTASSWVDLPRYQSRPLTVRHEVLDETRAIVLQEVQKARR